MRTRILYCGAAVAMATTALLFLGALAALAAPTESQPASAAARSVERANTAIIARRAISIPFGIDDMLQLSADGKSIEVTGHGTCQQGGERFRLSVMVRQGSTRSLALGRTEESCTGAPPLWEADARALGRSVFEANGAQVCALAIVYVDSGGSWVNQWCKDVTLQHPQN